jgi:hypothetical protein
MENEVIKGIKDFLKKYDLKWYKEHYIFQAPESRYEMVKLFRESYEKNNGALDKSIIKRTLRWAFFNDRRYLSNFLRNVDSESESKIKEVTKEGLRLAKEGKIKEAIRKLIEIKGVGNVTASKLLMFTFPNLFGMYDQFNGKAIYNLKVNGKPYFKESNPNKLTKKQYAEEFEKYTYVIREIAKILKMKPMEVDMALFRLGRGY